MSVTKAVLDLQTDLTQPNTPTALLDVANKDYVDTVAGGGPVDATGGSGGAVKGVATFDTDKGLEVLAGAIVGVKVDGTRGVALNGSGEVQTKVSTVEGLEYNGSGEQRVKLSAVAAEQGLEFTGGGALKPKVDGTSIAINAGTGNLEVLGGAVPNATGGPGDTGTLGKTRADTNKGLALNGVGTMEVKIEPTTLQFNGSGQLEVIGGGGGGSTGDVAHRIGFTRNITAVTAPTSVLIGGTQIDALEHPDAAITGQRFEFAVPDDYFQGPLELLVVYKMTTAAALDLRLTTQAEIADVTSGAVDVASYPETQQTFTPLATTLFERRTLLNVSQGDFGAGDTVNFFVKRLGTDGADTHTGAWQVVSYELRYESIVDQRVAISRIEFLSSVLAVNPAPTPGTLTGSVEIDTLDFPTGVDRASKFAFAVPDNWDGISDAILLVTYAMTSAAAATVRLTLDAEIADVVGGSVIVEGTKTTDLPTTADTVPHRAVAFAIDPANLAKGSDITAVFQRLGTAGADTHGGDFQLVSVQVIFTIAPTSGVSAVVITEGYLRTPNFDPISGLITTDVDFPAFGSTFDTFASMVSASAAGRVDCSFNGRLSGPQTSVAQLKINIFGAGASPQYRIAIYAEGSGGVPVFDSGLLAAPGAPAETIVLAGALSAQPVGQKRYAVVVEAHIDAGEELRCSFPFVRQE